MRCLICRTDVGTPPIVPDGPGRIGNFVFIQGEDSPQLALGFCDIHLSVYGNKYPCSKSKSPSKKVGDFESDDFNWVDCTSSALSKYAYDEENQSFAVWLKNSNVIYQYFDISPQLFEEFESSDSMGRFWQKNIVSVNGVKRPARKIAVH